MIKLKKIIAFLMIFVLIIPSSRVCLADKKIPISAEILTLPKCVDFCVGDAVDTRGLSLIVTYNDDSTEIITSGFDVSYDFSKAGKGKVVVSYTEMDVTVKVSYDVNVIKRPTLSADNIEVQSGNNFKLPIYISGNCGFMGIDLKVVYDAKVFIPVSVEKGTLITDGLLDDSVATASDGAFDIIWSGQNELKADGQLCIVTFYCKDTAKAGNSSIQISAVRENTYLENYSSISCNNATCTVNILTEKEQQSKKKRTLDNLILIMPGWKKGDKIPKPELKGNDGNGKVTYSYSAIGKNNFSSSVPSEPGTYIAKAYVAETELYYAAVATCVFTISDNQSQTIKPPKVGSVNNFKCTKYSPSSVTLSWKKLADVTGYEIYQYNTSKKKYVKVAETKTNKYSKTKLKKNTVYKFYVKAYKRVGKQKYYGKRSLILNTSTKRTANSLKSVKALGAKKVSVSWKKAKGCSGYEIYLCRNRKFNKGVKKYYIKNASKTSIKISKLMRKKTYYVRVRNYKLLNGKKYYSSWSNIKKVIVK